MEIKPIDDRLLVKRIEETEQKVGSIIVPDTAKEKPQMGVVMAIGNDEEMQELFAKKDRVLFAKYSGSEFEFEGTEYIILQRGDVLAKLQA